MTIFGLVHGAWQGAWCWDLVATELRARGHESVAVDLPIEDPSAGGEAYAEAVLSALRPYDGDIVLVGHSLGGLTVPLVADRRAVRRMVFLAGLMPRPGFSFDEAYVEEPDILMPGLGAGQTAEPDGASRWQPQAAIAALYPDAPPDLAVWAAQRLRSQHWLVSQEVTPLAAWPPGEVQVIACASDAVVNADWVRRSAKVRFGAEAQVIAGDHSPFLARPVELVDLLTR